MVCGGGEEFVLGRDATRNVHQGHGLGGGLRLIHTKSIFIILHYYSLMQPNIFAG